MRLWLVLRAYALLRLHEEQWKVVRRHTTQWNSGIAAGRLMIAIRVRGETSWKISRTETCLQTFTAKSRLSRNALPQRTSTIVNFAKAKRLRNPKNFATSGAISQHHRCCRSSFAARSSPTVRYPACPFSCQYFCPSALVVNSTGGVIPQQAAATRASRSWGYYKKITMRRTAWLATLTNGSRN